MSAIRCGSVLCSRPPWAGCGRAALVEQDRVEALGIEQPVDDPAGSLSQPAMQIDRGDATFAADAFDIDLVAVARRQVCPEVSGAKGSRDDLPANGVAPSSPAPRAAREMDIEANGCSRAGRFKLRLLEDRVMPATARRPDRGVRGVAGQRRRPAEKGLCRNRLADVNLDSITARARLQPVRRHSGLRLRVLQSPSRWSGF